MDAQVNKAAEAAKAASAEPAVVSHSPLAYQRLMDARKNMGDFSPEDNTSPRRRQIFGAPRYAQATTESTRRTDRSDAGRRYY